MGRTRNRCRACRAFLIGLPPDQRWCEAPACQAHARSAREAQQLLLAARRERDKVRRREDTRHRSEAWRRRLVARRQRLAQERSTAPHARAPRAVSLPPDVQRDLDAARARRDARHAAAMAEARAAYAALHRSAEAFIASRDPTWLDNRAFHR